MAATLASWFLIGLVKQPRWLDAELLGYRGLDLLRGWSPGQVLQFGHLRIRRGVPSPAEEAEQASECPVAA